MTRTEFINKICRYYKILQQRLADGKISPEKYYAYADRLQRWEENYQATGYLPW